MPCGIAAPSAVSPRCASAAAKQSPRRWKSSASHAGGFMKIQDARAVVTGGASGLGAAVARHISAQGGKVVILDVQEGPGRAAAAALGANVGFVRCDVPSEAEVNAAMDGAH